MNQNRLENIKKAFSVTNTVTDRSFVNNLVNLSTEMESLSNNGTAKVTKLVLEGYIVSSAFFSILPVIVQTAGTISNGIDLTGTQLEEILDGQIDDEFGFDRLRRVFLTARTYGSTNYFRNFRMEVPKKILDTLNAGVQTTRLQDIYLVFVGTGPNASMTVHLTMSIEHVVIKKGIIKR